MLAMEYHIYPKQCYVMFKILDEAWKITRASHIKEMIFTFGFGYVWLAQDVGNSKL